MSTTLWQMFTTAVRWARGTSEAAVATMRVAPAAQTPHRLLDEVSVASAAPTLDTHGADVEGYATLNIGYVHSSGGATSEVVIWVWDGEHWLDHSTQALGKDAGALEAFDSEGYPRIAVQLTTPPGAGNVSVKVFPHNEA